MSAPHPSMSRSVRHTRSGVVDAALRILDEQGLPDLTMRHLAGALDVQPSALYWHFPNKQTLLAAVSDRIVEGAAPAPTAAPASAPASRGVPAGAEPIRAAAAGLRAALLAHRDAAELVSSTEALGLGSGVALGRLTEAVERAGARSGAAADPHTTGMAATALLHFILGHVSHEQQRMQYRRLAAAAAAGGIAASGTDPADPASDATPNGATPNDATPDDEAFDDEAFDFGVALFVEGVTRALRPRPATTL